MPLNPCATPATKDPPPGNGKPPRLATGERASGAGPNLGRRPGAYVTTLAVDAITADPDVQPRVSINDEAVAQFTEKLLLGQEEEFPRVRVYFDGEVYWLADGFHRLAAHRRAGLTEVLAVVFPGGREDALLYACAANAQHDDAGLRRTNEDKRRAVLRLVALRPGWSGGRVAEHCGVTAQFVNKLMRERDQVETVSTSPPNGEATGPDYREGKDGKRYPVNPRPPAPPTADPGPESPPANEDRPHHEPGDLYQRADAADAGDADAIAELTELARAAGVEAEAFTNGTRPWRELVDLVGGDDEAQQDEFIASPTTEPTAGPATEPSHEGEQPAAPGSPHTPTELADVPTLNDAPDPPTEDQRNVDFRITTSPRKKARLEAALGQVLAVRGDDNTWRAVYAALRWYAWSLRAKKQKEEARRGS